jgi:hypothetical protein
MNRRPWTWSRCFVKNLALYGELWAIVQTERDRLHGGPAEAR